MHTLASAAAQVHVPTPVVHVQEEEKAQDVPQPVAEVHAEELVSQIEEPAHTEAETIAENRA